MKKQIFGGVLFIVIVGFSVFVYEYFSYVEVPDCGQMRSAKCVSTIEPYVPIDDDFGSYSSEDVAVRLTYIEANMRSHKVRARVSLSWEGAGEPPKAVWVQLRFHNFNGSNAGWTSAPFRVSDPFGEGRRGKVIEQAFDCGYCNDLSRNLYASSSIWTQANPNMNLVYETDNMMPVVVQEQR